MSSYPNMEIESLPTLTARVLIVDDHVDSLIYAKYASEACGYHVTIRECGNRLVETALTCKPDIILLDLCLNDTTGYEVFRQLKSCRQTQNIPVVAVTAMVTEDVRAQCVETGFTYFLAKPFTVEELDAAIRCYKKITVDTSGMKAA
ncbi:MAG: response regulator [Cyanobacteria bacterium P01_D01_bin.36]